MYAGIGSVHWKRFGLLELVRLAGTSVFWSCHSHASRGGGVGLEVHHVSRWRVQSSGLAFFCLFFLGGEGWEGQAC